MMSRQREFKKLTLKDVRAEFGLLEALVHVQLES